MDTIFVDSNIPMYLVGASHPHKIDSLRLLKQWTLEGTWMVTDEEVFQEILHRYAALNRKNAIQPALDALNNIVDEVFPIEAPAIRGTKKLLLLHKDISARTALHAAVMQQNRIKKILTFDPGFDQIPSIERIA